MLKINNVKIDYDLVAEQYAKDFGNYIEDLDIYEEFEKEIFNINGKNYEVTFKTAYINGEIISRRAEYEDLKRISDDIGLPLRKVKEMIK